LLKRRLDWGSPVGIGNKLKKLRKKSKDHEDEEENETEFSRRHEEEP